MAKKVGLKIGVGVAVLVGLYFLSKWAWGKAVDNIKSSLLASGVLNILQTETGLQVLNTTTGEVEIDYTFDGHDMDFPLAFDSTYTKSDNVAILQAYLLFQNPNLDMPIDGKFGQMTEDAVEDYTVGLTEYGYSIIMITDDSVVTEELYNDVITPGLVSYIGLQ